MLKMTVVKAPGLMVEYLWKQCVTVCAWKWQSLVSKMECASVMTVQEDSSHFC